ncbi:MAG: SIS domain-containing protein [Psychrosphaera sp.]|nr:SIS domain-containing protein [Psychrosphaera sp.]
MLENYFDENIEALEHVKSNCIDDIQVLVRAIVNKIKNGKTIFFVGVGGCSSLCDAVLQDMNGHHRPRNRKIKLCDLSANTSLILRNLNDLGADAIFSQQLESQGESGDLLITLSCSGESKSVVQATERANSMFLETSCITSYKKSTLRTKSDISIVLPFRSSAVFENTAHVVLHGIARMVEEALNDDR